jgi:hypothetical protein
MNEHRKKPESQFRTANKSFDYGTKVQYLENNKKQIKMICMLKLIEELRNHFFKNTFFFIYSKQQN